MKILPAPSWIRLCRVSAFLVAALALSSCSSSANTTSTPQAQNATPTATATATTVPTPTPTHASGSGGGSGGGATPTPTPTLPPAAGPPNFFAVTAPGANSSSVDYFDVDNVLTNGSPSVLVFVTANWERFHIYDNHTLGVFYDTGAGKWAIFHEDQSAFIPSATYNVYVRSAFTGIFVAHAPSSSSSADNFAFSAPGADGNPNAVIFITHNWNPNGVGGIYDNHPLGVYYQGGTGKWAIFHEDQSAYTPSASYNVMVLSSDGTSRFVEHACAAACGGDAINIGSSISNGNSHALLLITANWNPGNIGGTYDNHNLGVYYNTGGPTAEWAIFHQDHAAYTPNSAYNVLMIP